MAGTCKNCKYFKPGVFVGGYCHLNPPQLALLGFGQRNPAVSPNHSCSHWEPKYAEKYDAENKRITNKSNLIEILTTRYDQGEITKAEFEKIRKKILESK